MADPQFAENITGIVSQLQALFSKLASGEIKDAQEFANQYKQLVKSFESVVDEDHTLSSDTHIKQIEALLDYVLSAQKKYDQ